MEIEDIFNSVIAGAPLIYQLDKADEATLFEKFHKIHQKDTELFLVLTELLINAIEHGNNSNISIFLEKMEDYFYFVIKDDGPGIHQTIPNNKNLLDLKGKSPAVILRLVCEEGITGTGTEGRGMGLYWTSKICSSRGGDLLIATDQGMLRQRRDLFWQKNLEHKINGSVVCLTIRC
ncbi:MAG: sensor histidine kinase [Bacteriovoracaceae bacterium]|nr:sensor histidine kinase [Bacteriovoracaceae bacterium]